METGQIQHVSALEKGCLRLGEQYTQLTGLKAPSIPPLEDTDLDFYAPDLRTKLQNLSRKIRRQKNPEHRHAHFMPRYPAQRSPLNP